MLELLLSLRALLKAKPTTMTVPIKTLETADLMARAYGWEFGYRLLAPEPYIEASKGNPFLNPDWRSKMQSVPAEG